mmetsp:Transcript_10004/g.25820  ORF Transcript_10004/g.25820 Transcript_10004/m.25820 type:complete len:277 (+) Transcript_10004:652-1482(+)
MAHIASRRAALRWWRWRRQWRWRWRRRCGAARVVAFFGGPGLLGCRRLGLGRPGAAALHGAQHGGAARLDHKPGDRLLARFWRHRVRRHDKSARDLGHVQVLGASIDLVAASSKPVALYFREVQLLLGAVDLGLRGRQLLLQPRQVAPSGGLSLAALPLHVHEAVQRVQLLLHAVNLAEVHAPRVLQGDDLGLPDVALLRALGLKVRGLGDLALRVHAGQRAPQLRQLRAHRGHLGGRMRQRVLRWRLPAAPGVAAVAQLGLVLHSIASQSGDQVL